MQNDLIPRRVLFGNPERAFRQISPDGEWLTWVAPANGVMNIFIAPRATPDRARQLTFDQGRGITAYCWTMGATHLVYGQDTDGDENTRLYALNIADGSVRNLTPEPNVKANLGGVSRKIRDMIMVYLNDRDPQFHDLYAINPATVRAPVRMALEIERKFLATHTVLRHCRSGTLLVQGYLYTDARNTLRIRRADDRAFLTWKGSKSGATREEVECEVPLQMGEELLADIAPNDRIQKMRYRVEHAGAVWDVDVFENALDGLILAEIEMAREDEFVALPLWLGREVTSDKRYRNSRLAAGAMPDWLAA